MNINRTFSGLAIAAALWLGFVPGQNFAEIGAVNIAQASELASETRDLPSFNRIEANGSYELRITVGGEQSVRVETAERDLKRIKTEVRDDTLVLSYKERWFSFLFGDEKIITISLPALRGMDLSGAGDIDVSGIDSEAFELTVSGAADVSLEGSCGALEFEINGASDVLARGLRCETVRALINGVGSAELYASESIDAVLNGVGSIAVYGNPEKISKQINGLGSFEVEE